MCIRDSRSVAGAAAVHGAGDLSDAHVAALDHYFRQMRGRGIHQRLNIRHDCCGHLRHRAYGLHFESGVTHQPFRFPVQIPVFRDLLSNCLLYTSIS